MATYGPIADSSCLTGVRYEYRILQASSIREVHNTNHWFVTSDGFPAHTNQGDGQQHYGYFAVQANATFPIRVCGPIPDPVNAIIGINLPDQDLVGPTGSGSRCFYAPEFDWDLPFEIGPQKAGNFDLKKIPRWGTYWRDYSLNRMLEIFGATNPNPAGSGSYCFRLVYFRQHGCFTIQAAAFIGGHMTWPTVDESSESIVYHPVGAGAQGTVFHGGSVDIPPGTDLYPCSTVLGIHFYPQTATLDQYDYGTLAHDKRTGSVDFAHVDCAGGQPGQGDVNCQSCFQNPLQFSLSRLPFNETDVCPVCDKYPLAFSSLEVGE